MEKPGTTQAKGVDRSRLASAVPSPVSPEAAGPPLQGPVPTFRSLFEEHFDFVWRALRRLGVAERDAEDLTHEVFVRVHARLPSFDAARPIRPWLFAFAARVASDYRRLARHQVELLGDVEPQGSEIPPDEALVRRADLALIDRALAALEEEKRAVFVMHEIEEFGMPEIAAALDVPLATAYSRLRLARVDFAARGSA